MPPSLEEIKSGRSTTELSNKEWSVSHPPSSYGYHTTYEWVKTRDGTQIKIKIYTPLQVDTEGHKTPLVFLIHGGGWIRGNAETEEIFFLTAVLKSLQESKKEQSRVLPVVMIPEYRLAPENPFPKPLEDCSDALLWASHEARRFNSDGHRVILGGSSAGTQIAAVLALATRQSKENDGGFPEPIGLLLNVPTLCHPAWFPGVDGSNEGKALGSASYNETFKVEGAMPAQIMWDVWNLYIPNSTIAGDWRVSPLLGDLKGLPETHMFITSQCPLRDEGLAFAEKLKEAGVKTKVQIYENMPHTFAEEEHRPETLQFQKHIGGVGTRLWPHSTINEKDSRVQHNDSAIPGSFRRHIQLTWMRGYSTDEQGM